MRLLVDEIEALAREEVETVAVLCVGGNGDAFLDVDVNHGFEHHARTLLDELTDGVQIGGIYGAGGIETLAVLALGLAEELLPPFAGQRKSGIVDRKNLNALTCAQEKVTDCRVLETAVGKYVAFRKIVVRLCRACEHLLDVNAGNRDGKQTDGRKNGETAADVVSDHEAFVAVRIRLLAERAARLIGGGENSLGGAFLAVFLDQKITEYAECDCGLGGGTRLGNDVDADILILADIEDILKVSGADILSDEIDIGGILLFIVVIVAVDEFDCGACAELRAADTDYDQHVAHTADLFCRLLDLGSFLAVIVLGKLDPAEKIVALAGLVAEGLMSGYDLGIDRREIGFGYEAVNILVRKYKCHFYTSIPPHARQFITGNIPCLPSPAPS